MFYEWRRRVRRAQTDERVERREGGERERRVREKSEGEERGRRVREKSEGANA